MSTFFEASVTIKDSEEFEAFSAAVGDAPAPCEGEAVIREEEEAGQVGRFPTMQSA